MGAESNIGRQPERKSSQRQGPQLSPEWQAYRQWREQTPFDVRMRAVLHGDWPEGTPEAVIDIQTKTTAEEKLLGSIFGDYPSMDVIRLRSVEDVRLMRAGVAQMRRERLAVEVGEPTDTALTEQELQEKHRQMFGMLEQQMERSMSGLTDREQLVIRGRFGLDDGRPKTQVEMGQVIDRSPRTVKRVEDSALQKLRSPRQQQGQ